MNAGLLAQGYVIDTVNTADMTFVLYPADAQEDPVLESVACQYSANGDFSCDEAERVYDLANFGMTGTVTNTQAHSGSFVTHTVTSGTAEYTFSES